MNTLLQATVSFILKHLIHTSESLHFIISLLPRHKGSYICFSHITPLLISCIGISLYLTYLSVLTNLTNIRLVICASKFCLSMSLWFFFFAYPVFISLWFSLPNICYSLFSVFASQFICPTLNLQITLHHFEQFLTKFWASMCKKWNKSFTVIPNTFPLLPCLTILIHPPC